MNQFLSPSSRTPVEITDEEHTLILMMRMMRLNEIISVMMLNDTLPSELPNKHNHIKNIVNWHFQASYEVHVITTVIEFICTHPVYKEMFQHHPLDKIIQKYQADKVAESEGVTELYVHPYTNQCIDCKKTLKPGFSHRSKTVLSLVRTYKARTSLYLTFYQNQLFCFLVLFSHRYLLLRNLQRGDLS